MAELKEQIHAKRKLQQTQALEKGESQEALDLEEGEIREDSDLEEGEIREKRPKLNQGAFTRMVKHHLGSHGMAK